jgi:hypothetical protein
VTQNLVSEGEVLGISMPGKRVPEGCSGLRPSEKELPEWLSGMFCNKNTPVSVYIIRNVVGWLVASFCGTKVPPCGGPGAMHNGLCSR